MENNWISVKERLPDNTDNVLVCYGDSTEQMTVSFYDDPNGWLDVSSYIAQRITHWMPLPKPPKK